MKRYLPICLLLLSFSAYGALTKWVDADGKVHYSDEPPPVNVKTKTLATPHEPASGVPTPIASSICRTNCWASSRS